MRPRPARTHDVETLLARVSDEPTFEGAVRCGDEQRPIVHRGQPGAHHLGGGYPGLAGLGLLVRLLHSSVPPRR